MRSYLAVFLVVALLGGCASGTLFSKRSHATINDVSVPGPIDSGYKVVAVDGKPVERLESSVHTVIPFATVESGEHTLSLEPSVGNGLTPTVVTASFEAGKRYRIHREAGAVSVVEDVR